jgi:hypothetical protein
MPIKQIDRKDEIPSFLCACGAKLSLVNEQPICISCIEGNRACEETALNFARAPIVKK